MHLQEHNSCRSPLPPASLADSRRASHSEFLYPLLSLLLFVFPCGVQENDTAATQFFGKGVTISIVVHDPSGQPISSLAMVKLFRGTIPTAEAQTTYGVIGVKCWVYKGEILQQKKRESQTPVAAGGF